MPESKDISKIITGKTTRAEVEKILGPPSSMELFSGEGWYYIGEKTKDIAFFVPEVLTREVTLIQFDNNNVVTSITTHDKTQIVEIEAIEETTPTLGRDPSLLKEIFGGIGKYDEGKHRAGYV